MAGRKKTILFFLLVFLAGIALMGRVRASEVEETGQVRIEAVVLKNLRRIGEIFMPESFSTLVFGEPPMTINDGEEKTGEFSVQVKFFLKNAFQMQVDSKPDFNGVIWESFDNSKQMELPPGDGTKKIYARFKSLSGVPSKIISGSIILDTTSPSNISNFQAAAGDKRIDLEWENSPEPDFDKVKIVRNPDFYPSNPQDGAAVYDGKGESFIDSGLQNGATYYYAAFAYDDLGNYSSGAVAAATPGAAGIPLEIPITTATVPPEIEKIGLGYFEFIQNGKMISLSDGEIVVNRFQPLIISIPYEAVPEVLKTIMVTLKKGDKMFSFLLRVNENKTDYTATLIPPDTGEYPFVISILDYKNQAYKKINGNLSVVKAQPAPEQTIVKYVTIKKFSPFLRALFILLIVVAAEEIYRKARKHKKAKSLKSKVQTKF